MTEIKYVPTHEFDTIDGIVEWTKEHNSSRIKTEEELYDKIVVSFQITLSSILQSNNTPNNHDLMILSAINKIEKKSNHHLQILKMYKDRDNDIGN